MNKHTALIICLFFIFNSALINAQTISPQYEVATWQGFRKAAVSYTFDDGCSNQFAKAIPIFDEFGYKMTLFTVTNWTGNWQNLKNAAAGGHEIANHTATHPHLKTLSIPQQNTELAGSTTIINNNLGSKLCYTMAYPYCEVGNDSICKSLFIAVRGCQGFIEPKTPGSFMNVSSLMCGTQGSVKTPLQFQTMANSAVSKTGWLVYLIHGIDNDGGYSPLPSDTLRTSLQYLKDNDTKFWVSSFGTVARYVKERNCLSLQETSNQESLITFTVSDTLDNGIYNTPVTIRRILPAGWRAVNATQNDIPVKSEIKIVNNIAYIILDVVPDAGEVKLTELDITGIDFQSSENKFSADELNVWVRDKSLIFKLPETTGDDFSVSIFDMKGTRILNNASGKIINGNGTVSLSQIPNTPGIYILKVSNNVSSWSKQFSL